MSERPLVTSCSDSLRVSVVPVLSPEHKRFEQDLLRTTTCVPLPHRILWLESVGSREGWFCAAENAEGYCQAGFAIGMARSRALPGHRLLRVERFCAPADGEVVRAMLDRLITLVNRDRRVLRLSIEVCCFDETRRLATERLLADAGFVRSSSSRSYEHTLVLDLHPDEATLFASLDPKTRRDIRVIARNSVEVCPIEDPVWADRIEALFHESMSRTGGHAAQHDWAARIDLARTAPTLARIVGLFKTPIAGPDALVAFAGSYHHGDYAHYDASGATRSSGVRGPLSYALLWDLICWAKANSAKWFDFGGVTFGRLQDSDDALGGISDFKRRFTQNLVNVGAEWILEPHPLRARLARSIGATAQRLRTAFHR
jgi:hypothetical protein